MITVSVYEAKTNLSALLRVIEQKQETVLISRHGVAIAEIIPVPHKKRSELHSEVSDIKVLYNPVEPTEDEWDNV